MEVVDARDGLVAMAPLHDRYRLHGDGSSAVNTSLYWCAGRLYCCFISLWLLLSKGTGPQDEEDDGEELRKEEVAGS